MLARRVRHQALPARRNTLAGETSLAAGDGVFVTPFRWIHTFGMTFAIDAVFLDTEGRVLSVYHDLPPDRVSMPAFRARGVLKLPAGTLRSTETRIGDTVRFLGN
jgi:hypothetical protein